MMVPLKVNSCSRYTKSVHAPLLSVSKSHIEYTHPPHGSKRTQLSRVIADPLGLLSFSALPSIVWTGERP
jgi:hypothetical protein